VFPGDALFTLAVDAPDAYGSWAPRLPAQWFGAVWSTVVLVALLRMPRPSRYTGARFAAFLTLTFAGSFAVGFSRADGAASTGNISIGQALDASFILIGLILLIGSFVLRRKNPL
jgi:prolipoprotein diacylglyceryltransferase